MTVAASHSAQRTCQSKGVQSLHLSTHPARNKAGPIRPIKHSARLREKTSSRTQGRVKTKQMAATLPVRKR